MKDSIEIAPEKFRQLSLAQSLKAHFGLADCLVIPSTGGERTLTNQFGEPYHEDYMTLAKAFERSVNTVAVQVLHDLGIHQVTRQAQKHGIAIRIEMGLCIALGCSGVSLLQLTAAYAPFVNAGRYAKPVFITRIEETSGRVLYKHQPTEPKTVLSEWTAFRMRS